MKEAEFIQWRFFQNFKWWHYSIDIYNKIESTHEIVIKNLLCTVSPQLLQFPELRAAINLLIQNNSIISIISYLFRLFFSSQNLLLTSSNQNHLPKNRRRKVYYRRLLALLFRASTALLAAAASYISLLLLFCCLSDGNTTTVMWYTAAVIKIIPA